MMQFFCSIILLQYILQNIYIFILQQRFSAQQTNSKPFLYISMSRTMNASTTTPAKKGKSVKKYGAPVKNGAKKSSENTNLYERSNLEGTGSPVAKTSGLFINLTNYRSPEGKYTQVSRRTLRTLATSIQPQERYVVVRRLFSDKAGSDATQVNSDINNGN